MGEKTRDPKQKPIIRLRWGVGGRTRDPKKPNTHLITFYRGFKMIYCNYPDSGQNDIGGIDRKLFVFLGFSHQGAHMKSI